MDRDGVGAMCGITGWVDYGRDLRGQEPVLSQMVATMACRGPDAEGTWIAPQVALGHRRLSVIDIEGGRQPMSVDAEGRTSPTVPLRCSTYSMLSGCAPCWTVRLARSALTRNGAALNWC